MYIIKVRRPIGLLICNFIHRHEWLGLTFEVACDDKETANTYYDVFANRFNLACSVRYVDKLFT